MFIHLLTNLTDILIISKVVPKLTTTFLLLVNIQIEEIQDHGVQNSSYFQPARFLFSIHESTKY